MSFHFRLKPQIRAPVNTRGVSGFLRAGPDIPRDLAVRNSLYPMTNVVRDFDPSLRAHSSVVVEIRSPEESGAINVSQISSALNSIIITVMECDLTSGPT